MWNSVKMSVTVTTTTTASSTATKTLGMTAPISLAGPDAKDVELTQTLEEALRCVYLIWVKPPFPGCGHSFRLVSVWSYVCYGIRTLALESLRLRFFALLFFFFNSLESFIKGCTKSKLEKSATAPDKEDRLWIRLHHLIFNWKFSVYCVPVTVPTILTWSTCMDCVNFVSWILNPH